jgi:hypothetical protein
MADQTNVFMEQEFQKYLAQYKETHPGMQSDDINQLRHAWQTSPEYAKAKAHVDGTDTAKSNSEEDIGSFVGGYKMPKAEWQATDLVGINDAAKTALMNTQTTQVKQDNLADALWAQSRGQGQSLAEMQLRQAQQQNQINLASAMASQRGLNPGLARRIMLNQYGQMNAQTNVAAAQQRMQEQYAAQQQLAGVYGSMQQNNLNLAGLGSAYQNQINELQQQQALGNAKLKLGAEELDLQRSQGAYNTATNIVGGVGQVVSSIAGLGKGGGSNTGGGGDAGSSVGGDVGGNTGAGGDVGSDIGGGVGGGGGSDSGMGDYESGGDFYGAYGGEIDRVRRYADGGSVNKFEGGVDYGTDSGTDQIGTGLSAFNPLLGAIFKMGMAVYEAMPNADEKRMTTSFSKSSQPRTIGEAIMRNAMNASDDPNNISRSVGESEIHQDKTDFSSGGSVGGHAQFPGNDYRNDLVSAYLSPGEIVLPRSVTQSKDAEEKAAQFVAMIRRRRQQVGKGVSP